MFLILLHFIGMALATPVVDAAPKAPTHASPSASPVIVVLGDSLAAGGFGAVLGQNLGLQVYTLGIGGQKGDAIAARFGALPIHVALADPVLHIGENRIKAIWPEIFRQTSPAPRSAKASLVFGQQHIGGTYIRRGGDSLAQPDTNVFVIDSLPPNLPAAPNVAQLVLNPMAPRADVLIVSLGRNNPLPQDEGKIFAALDAIQGKQQASGGHMLVLSVPNMATPEEARGMPAYDTVLALNRKLALRYGESFFDIRAAYNHGGNPALPADRANAEADQPPQSLRADQIHYNDAGRHVWARAIGDALLARHWLTPPPSDKGSTR